MVSLSMTLSDPWTGFQGHGNFKRGISPKRRILQTQLLYRTLIGNHTHAINKQASYTYSLQPHCSYVNRANFLQASRGFQRQLGFLVFHTHANMITLADADGNVTRTRCRAKTTQNFNELTKLSCHKAAAILWPSAVNQYTDILKIYDSNNSFTTIVTVLG